MLLTGHNRRWEGRTAEWKKGWRNLHTDGEVARGRQEMQGDDPLGWADPLVAYRPFLSYNELGALLENKPSLLYDQLAGILGLEELSEARERLRQQRLARTRLEKDAGKALPGLLDALEALDDSRAATCLAALTGKTWDLDAIEATVLGTSETADPALGELRRLVNLRAPDAARVTDAVRAVREAADAVKSLGDSREAESASVAGLLEHALTHHGRFGDGDCPVCGAEGALDPAWRAASEARLADLRTSTQAFGEARKKLDAAVRAAKGLLRPAPEVLARVETLGLPAGAGAAWAAWSGGVGLRDPHDLAAHLEAAQGPLEAAVTALVEAARTELARREDRWRPVATDLAEWLALGRKAMAGKAQVPDLKAAEEWMKGAEGALRERRFAPIAERAQEVWGLLRQESHVELAGIELSGSSTRRRVDLEVRVDGTDSVALGVMSQGELHALALGLFIPRMTLDESPFHFLVVDDPVQSMDPHKVDGLARVLEWAAKIRQVLVLTHDARLAEAVRRMEIPATILEVTRRAGSAVEVRRSLDPVDQSIRDAWQLLRSQDALGPPVASQVAVTFCRQALEAAMESAIRRRRLGRGETHADVEELLRDTHGLHALASLVLFDDPGKGGDVYKTLNNRFDRTATDAFREIKEHAHKLYPGSLPDLVSRAERLARGLQELG